MAVLKLGGRTAPILRVPRRALILSICGPVGALRRVMQIFTDPLPADMRDEECSVVILFRASQALNCLTGGRDDMTFSARCHLLGRRARRPFGRLAWRIAEGAIDVGCAVLRGECAHCATAWVNYRARGRRT